MIKFYYNLSPNPLKVALALEEMSLAYEPIPIDTRKGEQFGAELTALNPNQKVPVIVDGDTVVFDSNAILLYLAEKTGTFLGDPQGRPQLLSWLMFVASGLGPFSGQAVHFGHFVSRKAEPYARRRYAYEAQRHYGVLDKHLAGRRYMLGDAYSIVDMGVWGWAGRAGLIFGPDELDGFPNVKRLHQEISARPAAMRTQALAERHAFKADFDEDALNNMFRFRLAAT